MKISKHDLLRDFETLKNYCKDYLLHPIEHIKTPPDISFESILVGTFVINIAHGIVRAIYSFNWIQFLLGLLITPFLAAGVLALTTLFLFYFFQISFQKTFSFKKISTVLFVAYLPAFLFFVASVAYPPLFLMGLLLMSALLAVGLVENFQVPRKTVLKLVSAGAFLAVVFWVFDRFYVYNAPIAPKTMDQLESEITD